MEWVETTGKTVDEAMECALDELGVDERDAEFEVVEHPRVGLFGRTRGEARVRARVRPTTPRPKEDRRDRRRRGKATGAGQGQGGPGTGPGTEPETGFDNGDVSVPTHETTPTASRPRSRSGAPAGRSANGPAGRSANGSLPGDDAAVAPSLGSGLTGAGSADAGSADAAGPLPGRRQRQGRPRHEEDDPGMDVPMEEQAKVATTFLTGLLDELGLPATVEATHPSEEVSEINVTGGELGILIGPKGATLQALQELTRTVVQRKTGAGNGRIFVDVAGYRKKRSEALTRFATQVAQEVLRTGQLTVLEPMTAADRKVVHDALTDTAGVATTSEGEDPHRRVVISPVEASPVEASPVGAGTSPAAEHEPEA